MSNIFEDIITIKAFNKKLDKWVYFQLQKNTSNNTISESLSGEKGEFLECDPDTMELVHCKLEQQLDGL